MLINLKLPFAQRLIQDVVSVFKLDNPKRLKVPSVYWLFADREPAEQNELAQELSKTIVVHARGRNGKREN